MSPQKTKVYALEIDAGLVFRWHLILQQQQQQRVAHSQVFLFL